MRDGCSWVVFDLVSRDTLSRFNYPAIKEIDNGSNDS